MRVFREREAGAAAGRFFRRGAAARRPEVSGDDEGPLADPVAVPQDDAAGRRASRPRMRPAPSWDDDAEARGARDAAGPADTGGDPDDLHAAGAWSARPLASRPRTGAPAPDGTPGSSPDGAPDLFMSDRGARLPAEERLRQFTRGRVRLSRPEAGGSGDDGFGGDGVGGDGLGGEGADSPFAARARLSSRPRSAPRRIWDIEDESGAEAEPGDAGPDQWDAPRPAARPAARATASRDGAPPDGHHMHDAPPQGRAASRPPAFPGPQAGPPSDEDEMIAYARAQVARIAEAGMADDLGDGHGAGRAKTRLLGFQSRDFAARDPFSQGASDARRGPMFPVGWVVVTGGPGRGASYALTAGVATFGRGDDQTVCLDFGDTAISRQAHASIAYDPETNRFYLGAGAKSNLVRLNDRPVLATEQIEDGDTIRIGETTLRFAAFCGPGFAWAGAGGSGGGRDATGEG